VTRRSLGRLEPVPEWHPTRRLVLDWVGGYVSRPHAELGRRGPVCPFVARALASDCISLCAWHMPRDPRLEAMVEAVDLGMQRFRELSEASHEPALTSLVIVFEQLGEPFWHLIDDVHRIAKPRAVADGLMLGQFHPACEVPAVHNPEFPVSRAPLPLIVVRHMTTHDILFLEEDREWVEHFSAWLDRSGHEFSKPAYRRRYEAALRRSR
jgi:hypothetical protein